MNKLKILYNSNTKYYCYAVLFQITIYFRRDVVSDGFTIKLFLMDSDTNCNNFNYYAITALILISNNEKLEQNRKYGQKFLMAVFSFIVKLFHNYFTRNSLS